ncbi:unnamed protein product, partial [Ectocarpus sp. 6 AP-2014]
SNLRDLSPTASDQVGASPSRSAPAESTTVATEYVSHARVEGATTRSESEISIPSPAPQKQDTKASFSSPSPSPSLSPSRTGRSLSAPPRRATLILSDNLALKPSDGEGRCPSNRQGERLSAVEQKGACHGLLRPPGNGRRWAPASGSEDTVDERAVSSPRSERSCLGGRAPRREGKPGWRPSPVAVVNSPRPVRTPRVLKTARDFAQTIRRVYNVDLSGEE